MRARILNWQGKPKASAEILGFITITLLVGEQLSTTAACPSQHVVDKSVEELM